MTCRWITSILWWIPKQQMMFFTPTSLMSQNWVILFHSVKDFLPRSLQTLVESNKRQVNVVVHLKKRKLHTSPLRFTKMTLTSHLVLKLTLTFLKFFSNRQTPPFLFTPLIFLKLFLF